MGDAHGRGPLRRAVGTHPHARPRPRTTPRLRTMNDIGLTAWLDSAPATAIALSGAAVQADDAGERRPSRGVSMS